jgi:hypothetical protein
MHLNPKNMFVKVLAETGVLGFALFTAFVMSHFRHGAGDRRYVLVRNIAAVSLLFDYVSLDSFALTTDWTLLGLLLLLSTGRDAVLGREAVLAEAPSPRESARGITDVKHPQIQFNARAASFRRDWEAERVRCLARSGLNRRVVARQDSQAAGVCTTGEEVVS